MLFGAIKSLHGGLNAEQDRRMTTAFETHLQTVVSRLHDRLDNMKDSAQRHTEILMAKHGLYDVCFQEMITFAYGLNPQFSSVLRRICTVHSELFQTIEGVLAATALENAQLRNKLATSESETAQLLEAAETLEKEAETHQAEMLALRKQLRKLQAENDQLRNSSSTEWPKNERSTTKKGSQPPPPPSSNQQRLSMDDATYTVRNLTLKQLKVCEPPLMQTRWRCIGCHQLSTTTSAAAAAAHLYTTPARTTSA